MIDSIICAWIAATADDFGGSLDEHPSDVRDPGRGATPRSGVPYCYRFRKGWQVRIPGVRTQCFRTDELDAARDYVRLHVEAAHV